MAPANGVIELAGGTQHPRRPRPPLSRGKARCPQSGHRYPCAPLGTELNDKSLTPGDSPHIGPTSFETWLARA